MRVFGTQKRNLFQSKLIDFENWLMSIPECELTLSRIAGKALSIFGLDYCCIHEYGARAPQLNISGLAIRRWNEMPGVLRVNEDHPAGTLELVEEQELGVRNLPIRVSGEMRGVLVVKGSQLSNDEFARVAAAIGARFCRDTGTIAKRVS